MMSVIKVQTYVGKPTKENVNSVQVTTGGGTQTQSNHLHGSKRAQINAPGPFMNSANPI